MYETIQSCSTWLFVVVVPYILTYFISQFMYGLGSALDWVRLMYRLIFWPACAGVFRPCLCLYVCLYGSGCGTTTAMCFTCALWWPIWLYWDGHIGRFCIVENNTQRTIQWKPNPKHKQLTWQFSSNKDKQKINTKFVKHWSKNVACRYGTLWS